MTGLELSYGYFKEYGEPMLRESFPEVLPFLAAGFVGSGSERYGFDDEISRDHDFEPGFCLFLPSEEVLDRRTAFRLERAYAKLPKSYKGFERQLMSPVGGNRNGVMRTADFYLSSVGAADGELSVEAWLKIPDWALAEATNGEVFFDSFGEFTKIREKLRNMPSDVLLKRLAGNILIMAQAGQYNFVRCLRHGEHEAAQLACHEFACAAMKAKFLLEGKYMPYYKWSFRALRSLAGGAELAEKLSFILCADSRERSCAERKYELIEETASEFVNALREKALTKAVCGDLEKHAYSVNDHIKDGIIRNLNILTAV